MSEKNESTLTRRSFIKLAGLSSTAAVASATVNPPNVQAGPGENKKKKGSVNYAYSVCDMCMNKCGLIARVEDGVIKKLDPNPKFLKSRGMLCARGNAGLDRVYDPDRLQHPLLRVGERGEGKWKQISWDEAYELMAEKFNEIAKKYTRCGMLFTPGSDMQSTFVNRFAEVYGSYNITTHESNCLISRNRAFLDTYGEVPFADLLNTNYVLMSGSNRFEALVTPDSTDLMTAKKRGCKIVVLDPRYTKTAALADEWFPIKPGTDMAFFLAVTHVIINENLYDAEYADKKLFGLAELRDHVQQYSPQWAEKECEIPAKDIIRIARELAAAAPEAIVYPGRRSSDYIQSTQIRRSMAIVNAMLGNWDRPGGLTATRQVGLSAPELEEAPFYEDNPDDRVDMERAPLMFAEEGSYKHIRDAILEENPYPVKGWFIYKFNPMQSGANRQKTIQMMKQMDFIVNVDITMTDTALYSDLVLPSASYLERTDPASGLQGSSACACVVTRDKVIEPLYESKPVFDILKELAHKMDLGEYFDFTVEDYRKQQLRKLPNALKILKKDGVYYNQSKLYGIYEGKIYKTKSKKIELMNTRYEEMGADPMPVYKRPKMPKSDQFRIVVGRNAYFTHGSTSNYKHLHELMPVNQLWMHPKSGARLGIKEGDLVSVKSSVSTAELEATFKFGIREDTVYMDSGYGLLSGDLKTVGKKGACLVELLEDHSDALTGNMAMHETLVTVQRKGVV